MCKVSKDLMLMDASEPPPPPPAALSPDSGEGVQALPHLAVPGRGIKAAVPVKLD